MLITAKTIPEARYAALQAVLQLGYNQPIEKGSYEKEDYRLQLPGLAVIVTSPLFDPIPVPAGRDWPVEVTRVAAENYLNNYLLSGEPGPNENYRYSARANRNDQLQKAIELLRKTRGLTNQACVEIGSSQDIDLADPACLRCYQFVYDTLTRQLNLHCFFRSNDLYSAAPLNWVGLTLLLECVADYAELQPGSFYYCCSAPHVYGKYLHFLNEIIKF